MSAAAAAAAAAAVLPGVTRSPIGCTTEDPSPADFTKWCAERSVLWPKCGMAVSEATGRCVVATEDIKQGEVVVEVPDDAVLMGENSQIQELLAEDGLLKPAENALLEVQGLILAVMYEKALGASSAWAPCLAFLPSSMQHMPLYWSSEELEELRGTAAHDKMMGRVQHPADAPTRMSQLFDELVLPFVQSHGRACSVLLGGQAPEDLTEEAARELLWPAYCWATAAVASYSFVLGDAHYQGMVPVWDLLNHITGAVNVKLHHDPERGVLQMIATQDILKGAEVVNCYGHLSNAELLRGYGYVEQHNSIQHVQIPAQFLIRAAAGAAEDSAAAAAAAGGEKAQGQQHKQGAAGEAAAQDGSSEGHSEDNESGSDEGDDAASSDDGDDAASSSDAESSSDDDDEDEEEPDWDLEDDDELLQKQQQQPAPALATAQQQIADWEDRWQLCFVLKLLPKNGVFQVPGGGLGVLPQQLLPALLLMLVDAGDFEKLYVAAAAATSKAAAAAAAAADSKAKKGKKQTKQQQKKQKQKQQAQKGAVAVEADTEHNSDAAAAAGVAAASKELAQVDRLQFCAAGRLLSALQLLVALMQSRYSCSLADDEAWLTQQQQQQPRLAAAVLARVGEKRVLQELRQALAQPAVAKQLIQQARKDLRSALQQLVQDAAAAAAAPAHECCGVVGCPHEHHQHEHEHGAKQQKQQQPEAEGAAGKRSAGKKRKDPEGQQQQQAGKSGALKASCKAQKATEGKKAAAAAAASAPSSGGFAFNFQM